MFPSSPWMHSLSPSSCQLAHPAFTSPAPLPSPTLHDFRCPAPTAGLPQIQAGLLSFPRETNLNKERLGAASRRFPGSVCSPLWLGGAGCAHSGGKSLRSRGERRSKAGPSGEGRAWEVEALWHRASQDSGGKWRANAPHRPALSGVGGSLDLEVGA